MPAIQAKHRTINRKQNMPDIRFVGFKNEWEEVSFGDLFQFKQTNSFSRDDLNYEQGKVKNIHYGDIHTKFAANFDVSKERVPFINTDIDILNIKKDSYCIEGDLVIADASEDYEDVGKAIEIRNLNNEKVVAGLHTLLARRVSESFAPGFLGYLMRSKTIRHQIKILAQGTKVLGISPGYLSEVLFKIPSKDEQQRITSFLESIDCLLGNLKMQRKYLSSYKIGMMQKIFSQEIRFKDKSGKTFPAWKEKMLRQISNTYNGLSGKSAEDFGSGEPYITYKQIFDNSRVDINRFGNVKVGSEERQNKAQFGDIFFTISSETPLEVGYASVLLDKDISPYLNSFSFGFRFNSLEDYSPYFAQFFFRSSVYRREVVKLAQGSTRYNISKTEFMKMKFSFPVIAEQEKIADFFTTIDKIIEDKNQQIHQATQWKKGLMQQLFI